MYNNKTLKSKDTSIFILAFIKLINDGLYESDVVSITKMYI